MAGDKYPGLLFHSIKHQYLLKQIDALIGRSKSNGARLTSKAAPLTEFNMSFLRDWFVSHILSEDVNFGLWINEHGKY